MREEFAENKKIKIEDLGYEEFFESNRKRLKLDSFEVARVIAEYKEAYRVKNQNGEYLAKITGKQMFNALSREDYPAVGDWAAITIPDKEHAVIHKVLPRKTAIKRKYSGKKETQIIATNINVAFVVESVDRDYSLNRFERYFSLLADGGIKPVIILNKIDLVSKEELDIKLNEIKNRFSDVDFISTSIITSKGLDKFKNYITKGKTYCFLGSSGVGKSSLINKLIGKDIIKTENISSHTGRGRHITTKREMYFLEGGGILVDNPGIREVGMTDAGIGIDNIFNEITELARECKYSNCTHTHEPGCEVVSALRAGKIDEAQYLNYINLKKEAGYYQMTKLEKKEKDRKFGKLIKTAKKQFKKYQ